MRSIRFLYVLGEGLTLLVAVAFILLLVDGFHQDTIDEHLRKQATELEHVDVLFQTFLEDNKKAFKAFSTLPDKESSVTLMTGFSDLYFVDDGLKVTRILKKTGRSFIFAGLDLSNNKLGMFLAGVTTPDPSSSSVYRSAETDELSTYLAARMGSEWLVGRVGLDSLQENLRRVAEYSHSILIIASEDGYVLSSSWEPLPFQVLPEGPGPLLELDGHAYYFLRASSRVLANDIVILTPREVVDGLMDGAYKFSRIFVAVILILFLIKTLWQAAFFLRPLARFSMFIGGWSPEIGLTAPPPVGAVGYREIAVLNDTFQGMTRRISSMFEELKGSEGRMRAILDSLEMGICAVSRESLVIIYANPAMSRMLGLPVERIVGAPWRELLNTGEESHALEAADEPASMEGVLSTRDGKAIPVLVGLSHVVLGERDCILESFIDLSSLKAAEAEKAQLEEQLLQARKMEAIGKLAGGVAHDFNNLLQAINGYAELAIDTVPAGHPAQEALKQIATAGERAAKLVAQLLAFGRRQILQPSYLDVNAVITSLLKMLGRLIGEDIRLDFVPQARGSVHADRGMLEQVIMNVCINGRDAMPAGGVMTISTGNRSFAEADIPAYPWAKPGDYIYITIADTGTGMDPDTLAQIFEPFFTTKALGKGTGLGLATVYGIVSQHDGLVHAESMLGNGTAITIYLPAQVMPSEEKVARRDGTLPGGRETILLAEDNDSVRDLARLVLSQAGYCVLEAADGLEADALFQRKAEAIDLLLLDVVMPQMGGRAVYERARERKPGIRVIFASGHDESAIHTNFVLEQGLNFIKKPYDRAAILKLVRDVLDA